MNDTPSPSPSLAPPLDAVGPLCFVLRLVDVSCWALHTCVRQRTWNWHGNLFPDFLTQAKPWDGKRGARRSLLAAPATTVVSGAAAIGIVGKAPATCWDSSNGKTVISAKCTGAKTQQWDMTAAGGSFDKCVSLDGHAVGGVIQHCCDHCSRSVAEWKTTARSQRVWQVLCEALSKRLETLH